jgi:hypothetical protein
VIITEEDYLQHYGTKRHSGRYPWGSGEEPYQDGNSFLGAVDELSKKGLSQVEIAESFGMTTTQLRAYKSIAKNEKVQAEVAMVQRLKDKGYGNVEIGKRLGIPESTVRTRLKPGEKVKDDELTSISNMLKNQVKEKQFIDVGSGVETQLGISKDRLGTALEVLKAEGYTVHNIQVDTGSLTRTTVKVLAPPGTTYKEIVADKSRVKTIEEYSNDNGRTFLGIHPPLSINSNRVAVRYAEDGGDKADGVIYVRPGVKDVSIGKNRYAQVRIAVDGTHYLKGMAVYKDDLPAGVDLMFNTSKNNTGNKLDAMKSLKDDVDNPFGSYIRRQLIELDGNGQERVSSVMNLVNEEGNWDKWSRTLSSQTLSKQSPVLAKQQLAKAFQSKKEAFDEISALTNPIVKKKLLQDLADDADSSAVHLKAAALPRSSWHVILPISSMKETEIYAPNFRDGERVALIRYPHGGKFEIPELEVNNRNAQAKAILGRAKDAVGIHHKVAERLSGADFDGDAVLVIPNSSGSIKSSPALQGLKNFDPKVSYPGYEGMKVMDARTKAIHMGQITNLIADMTIRKANDTEIAKAVRHSMVVIDAEKHGLNYKQSAIDNEIALLKKKYQGGAKAGASTLITRASAETRVPLRKAQYQIDPVTGKKVYIQSPRATWVDKEGKTHIRKMKSTRLAETDDAATLSSGTVIESVYVEHSNRLKALGNQARRELLMVKPIPYSPSARTTYAKEVASLNASLNVALKNRPRERQARLIADTIVSEKRRANPNMEYAELKKIQGQALTAARARTNPGGKQHIVITDAEWKAIQAGAISSHKLAQILDNADMDVVKKLATPRSDLLMSPSNTARAKALLASGRTQAEVADTLGVSLTTLKKGLGGS